MLLDVKRINKSFDVNNKKLSILEDLSFNIDFNEIISIYGASGSGKSTLLNIIAGLIGFDSGEIILDGKLIKNSYDFLEIRKNKLGIVFQEDYLLKEFTCIENIMLPKLIIGSSKNHAYKKAYDLLNQFNLLSKKDLYPKNMSGGEKQRISILRAVINNPQLILADEPTGNIDEKNKEKIFSLFNKIIEGYDSSILIATHDNNVSKISNKILNLLNRKLN